MTSLTAPPAFQDFASIPGLTMAVGAAEIKCRGREDMVLAVFAPGTAAAGVFTQSQTAGAPVLTCREHLDNPDPRALVINSGNSNAFTGKSGMEHCRQICETVAKTIGCEPGQVFIASTGVIGEQLPITRMLDLIPSLFEQQRTNGWLAAARAIMTTDTFPKGATVKTSIDGTEVTINGFAKGSGMIAPDMATLLAFCFTDARLPSEILQQALFRGCRTSFNAITVDSDTSTSDTLMMFATGAAGNAVVDNGDDPRLSNFRQALEALLLQLALQIVRDGEGASKLIEVRVTGAENEAAAKVIAASVANSPLVKTAIAGEDANWGRVVMAVGKSGQKADRDRLEIKMGGIKITENGGPVTGFDESRVTRHLQQDEILIEIDVGIHNGSFTMWTCDLTREYISINADYRS